MQFSSYLPPIHRTGTTHSELTCCSESLTSKKARDNSPVKSDSTSPETLSLSVLTWIGSPRTFNADGEALDGYVGEYRSAHTSDWLLDGWDEGRQAFQYSPSPNAPLPSFPYSREAFTDTAGSSITYYGGIICHEMSPVACIGLPEDDLWTETYRKPWVEGESEGEPVQNEFDDYPREAEVHPGPPFLFYECDFPDPDETPHRFFRDDTVLIIDQPDLPGQVEGGADTVEGEEPDSSRGVGWRGPWIDELIHLDEGGAPLGERTNTYED
ncbi:hypothetical protein OF83DRAFT_1123378 [Amylostereum chailletii]|nr:hypothetical protein OF83DRAFT_1123378 [Amylostereum chailletii]